MNTNLTTCPNCQREIQADSPGGICPECLLGVAVSDAGSSFRETLPRKGLFNAPSAETLSDAIDSIEVQELLGHGGMGAVYRARQINLDRPVALKILSPQLGNDPGFAERFEREAKTLARLNHPNIVTVYDFGRAGEYCYLIMELVEGVNLRDAIVSGGVTPQQSLEIVPRICEALQYAHDKGVVHRDIKPENILVGVDDQVKIADFGLAKLLDHSEANFTLTATQQVLGTRNYMAPEQIEKPTTVDHRADIYSLGVVFYELLTGELPLGRFSLPSEKSRANGQLDDVVMRALEKEPARRFQQASEVQTAVESVDLAVESPLEPFNGQPSIERTAHTKTPPLPEKPTNQEKPVRNRVGRRVSLPFRNDNLHGGLSPILGIAHLNEHDLEIEFRVHKLGVMKSPRKTINVPYYRLANITVTRGVFSSTLEIHASSLEVLDQMPGTAQGSLKMSIEKSHRQLLEDFRVGLEAEISNGSEQEAELHGETTSHVPFTIDHDGIRSATGIAKLTPDYVVVEYELTDFMGSIQSGTHRATIPLNSIIAMRFRHGIIHDSIEVQTNGIDNVASIPNSSQGKFKLLTKKRDRMLGTTWMRNAFRGTGLTMPDNLVEKKPLTPAGQKQELRQKILFGRKGLLLVAIVNLAIVSASSLLVFVHSIRMSSESLSNFFASFVDGSGISPSPGNWIVHGIVGPAICMLVALMVFWLTGKQRKYGLVVVGLAFLLTPWHVGSIVAVPVGIILAIILFNRENKQIYMREADTEFGRA